ncbi:MAG: hypothetical protein NC930_06100 [Candidatus Omnitrophica bacterium]|nr:hypothetical protein [Candidatus Omnitrophota bacterium]
MNQDCYRAEAIRSNLFVSTFPCRFDDLMIVTCWRKDNRFHKEIIEYVTEDGSSYRTAHMDIEPIEGSVLYRWHKHRFPPNLTFNQPSLLTIRVILDQEVRFESQLLIEKKT